MNEDVTGQMQQVHNPVEVEEAIRNCANRIAKSVTICSERYDAFMTADREYDQAFAVAFLKASGPQTEKRYAAEVATKKEREARDVADVAYRYADRTAKAVMEELRAWQSVGTFIRQAYNVAGRGEY